MLDLISFVGVDEKTNLDDLIVFDEFSNLMLDLNRGEPAPVIEYGFLYSIERSQTDDKRYPSLDFIGESVDYLINNGLMTSIHLCGADAIKLYLDGDEDLLELCTNSRVQLNFKMADYDPEDLLTKVEIRARDHNRPVILQANKSKKVMIDRLLQLTKMLAFESEDILDLNIDLLHDGSGGFGREIEVVETPFDLFYTGYAGGLNPANVAKVLALIDAKNTEPSTPYYIDMESGVREDNYFSIAKCQQVIAEVVLYEKAHHVK